MRGSCSRATRHRPTPPRAGGPMAVVTRRGRDQPCTGIRYARIISAGPCPRPARGAAAARPDADGQRDGTRGIWRRLGGATRITHADGTWRTRPLPRRRLCRRLGRRDLPRSHLHLDAGAVDHARPVADEARDELRLQRLRRRLRRLRGAVGLVGRARRDAARADADRLLVVRLHHRDGGRVELYQHAGDPVPLRRRRGRRVAERGAHVLAVDPGARARARPGRLLRRRVPGRRPDAGAGGRARAAARLARRLRLLRPGRLRLGRRLVSLVPRRTGRASRRRPRRARADHRRARRRGAARRRRPHACARWPSAPAPGPSVSATSRTATGRTSS